MKMIIKTKIDLLNYCLKFKRYIYCISRFIKFDLFRFIYLLNRFNYIIMILVIIYFNDNFAKFIKFIFI